MDEVVHIAAKTVFRNRGWHGPPRPPEHAGQHHGQDAGDLFAEFEGKHAEGLTDGDVKYHNGFSSDLSTRAAQYTCRWPQPVPPRIVNPVVEGSVRARQDRRNDEDGSQVLPVLVHGDAAFADRCGHGNAQTGPERGYGTGGTLHIVINNQIGFTR